ncbi:unnamed protein product [Mytilus edulis]|uniref:SGNH hydrolase-type esterase domain-containing protein n=1 Tax=Mytilus edulis TaxID=6550 RepID=A0A8S3PNQ5_MYTED|nr:unnamed protein product [Mytilus edulis]
MKSLESDDKLDNDKVDNLDNGNAFINKCTHFCKKYKKDLLCDVNVDTLNIKINKVGLVAQDKLNDTEFKNTIEIHNQIVQSGYPNYLVVEFQLNLELIVRGSAVSILLNMLFLESTYKNKKTQLESYFMFCIYFELMPVPATVHVLTLYAQFLSRSFKSVDSIKNYLSSVRYLHLLLDLEYPQFEAFHLRLVLRGLCRIKAHCQKQALPITPHILLQIYKKLDMNSAYDATIWCLFLHAFFLMFRKSNLVPDSISTFDHNKQLCRDSIIFDCKRNFFEKRATIVSASIPKYVSGIDGCTTQAFPGATIGRLTELISSGKVDLISLDFVIVHVGTNNISSSQSVDTIISYFGDLIHKLKKMTFAKLIFTSILPRPVDHMKTGAKVNKVNTELKRLCKRNNLLYCNLYRSFLLDNIPDASLFAPRDGLHLNFAGTELFRKKIINIIKHQSI